MKTALCLLLTIATLCGQGWYQTATPTNALTCTVTNVGFVPVAYTIYWFTTNGTRRYQSPSIPIPYTNFWGSTPTGIYSLQMTVTSSAGVETLPSTNIYVYWNVPPVVPGGPVGIITR